MALITCPDCQKEVSDQAVACIHCGRPVVSVATSRTELKKKFNRASWMLFAGSLLLGLVGAASSVPAIGAVAVLCFVAALAVGIVYYFV